MLSLIISIVFSKSFNLTLLPAISEISFWTSKANIFLHSVFFDSNILIIPVPVPISNILLSFFKSFAKSLNKILSIPKQK